MPILNVTAVSNSDHNVRNEITITNVCGSLTEVEIQQMVADAEIYRTQDIEGRQHRTARWELEEYCHKIKNTRGSDKNI